MNLLQVVVKKTETQDANLIKPCDGSNHRSVHRQRVIESIARHELAPGVASWPDLRPHGRLPAE